MLSCPEAGSCKHNRFQIVRIVFQGHGFQVAGNLCAKNLQRLDHSRGNTRQVPDLVPARYYIFLIAVYKPHDLIIPARLPKALEQFGIHAGDFVVEYQNRDKLLFDGLDKQGVSQDILAKRLATNASRYLLEEQKKWFSRCPACCQGGRVIPCPSDVTNLNRIDLALSCQCLRGENDQKCKSIDYGSMLGER